MTLEITAWGSEGRGIGHTAEGKVVFVPGAIPGETVEAGIVKETSKIAEARLIEVIKRSDLRVDIPQGLDLPGLNLAHVSLEGQAGYKALRVRECLERIGGFSSEETEAVLKPLVTASKTSRYRNHVQYKLSSGRISMSGTGSDKAVPIDTDGICYAVLWEAAQVFEDCFERFPNNFMDGLVLRGSERTKEILIEITSPGKGSNEVTIRDVKRFLETTDFSGKISGKIPDYKLRGIVLRISGDKVQKRTRTGKRICLEGEDHYEEILLGKRFRIRSGAFFQVNIEQAEKLYLLVKEGIKGFDPIYDIYCGAGSIGLSVKEEGQTLYGIESVPEAVASAKINAGLNGCNNVTFLMKQAEKTDFAKEGFPLPEAVIVDPPRKGMDIGFIRKLIDLAPERIVYVSCDPATMARDLKLLKDSYKIMSVTPVDMFPQTSHVETCVILSKRRTE